MQVEEESAKQYVDIARTPDKEMRPQRPVPLGLRPGRSSASLPGLTISTYGLRRAPRIRSVLAATHHAPIIEIGSKLIKLALGITCVIAITGAHAQNAAGDYPNRSIRIIVTFPPGGPTDIIARAVGQKLTEAWG